jgi:hypothetical protein
LEINLRAIGQGTDLLLIQTGVPEADLEKYEHGWHEYYWSPLFDFLREQAAQRRKK